MFIANKQPVTRLAYGQYLVSSQINYTLTNFADHSQDYSHDQLNGYLRDDTPQAAAGVGAGQRFNRLFRERLFAL